MRTGYLLAAVAMIGALAAGAEPATKASRPLPYALQAKESAPDWFKKRMAEHVASRDAVAAEQAKLIESLTTDLKAAKAGQIVSGLREPVIKRTTPKGIVSYSFKTDILKDSEIERIEKEVAASTAILSNAINPKGLPAVTKAGKLTWDTFQKKEDASGKCGFVILEIIDEKNAIARVSIGDQDVIRDFRGTQIVPAPTVEAYITGVDFKGKVDGQPMESRLRKAGTMKYAGRTFVQLVGDDVADWAEAIR
jgi:hypothetical protein